MREDVLLKNLFDNLSRYYQWKSAEQQAILNNDNEYIFNNIYERQSFYYGYVCMIKEELEKIRKEYEEELDIE